MASSTGGEILGPMARASWGGRKLAISRAMCAARGSLSFDGASGWPRGARRDEEPRREWSAVGCSRRTVDHGESGSTESDLWIHRL